MNHRPFLSVVPKSMQIWAIVVISSAVVAGIAVALFQSTANELPRHLALYSAGGLVVGALLATWLLCVGYVYADARQRAMRPVPWTLVVILLPHLLGFLLYFAMRQPLAAFCPHCGLALAHGQRFCSWCGSPQTMPSTGVFQPSTQQPGSAG